MALTRADESSGRVKGLKRPPDHDLAGVESLETTTRAWSKRNTSTFRIETVLVDGSTIHTAGRLIDLRQGRRRYVDDRHGVGFQAPDHGRPKPHGWRRIGQADLDLESPGLRDWLGRRTSRIRRAQSPPGRPSD